MAADLQLAAVLAAAEGRDFVLIGPPGTGKSQTITNIIADQRFGRRPASFGEWQAAGHHGRYATAARGVEACLPAPACVRDELTVYGDGSQTRSFCYVSDMVAGLLALMEADFDGMEPVNLGNPPS
ncbi:NAD-dependent epimerase/dehydratase family protein [Paracoccus mutanolyticus]|uniref:NAD-dependent epimerase/dehydratase family protein n=1 Tax=Paracoccus mutanolyticus TaxID=1499308 RepID=UPI000DDB5BCC